MHDFLRKHLGHMIRVLGAGQDRESVYSFDLRCLDCGDDGHFPFIGKL